MDYGQMTREIHVLPVDDLRAHQEQGRACWCEPRLERAPKGGVIVIHHAADGRDLLEAHGVN